VSQPAGRSRDASLLTNDMFGLDGSDWLDMASGSGNKSSSQAKSTVPDRPHSEGNVADKAPATRQSNNSHCFRGLCFLQGVSGSWKVMEFRKTILQAWKVVENDCEVMEFLALHKLLTIL